MTRPEERARQRIDQRLARAGWLLQDMGSLNPGAARGIAYGVHEIVPQVTQRGETLRAREWVDHVERQTRKKRWAQTGDDIAYTARKLGRSVVNPNKIRLVLEAMKEAVETYIYSRHRETPKTLIFAKTDSHADDIVQMLREVDGQGNAFCRKITGGAADAKSALTDFRNGFHPRIAVTVDMIATGTDVKPLEVLVFMCDVRSRGYYEPYQRRALTFEMVEALHLHLARPPPMLSSERLWAAYEAEPVIQPRSKRRPSPRIAG